MSTGNKLSRLQLKALVKECLVELLQEGLGSGSSQSMGVTLPVNEVRRPQNIQQQRRISPLDQPVTTQGRNQRNSPSGALAEAVRQTAGGNSVMADILADTAMTTLQEQIANESSSERGSGSRVQQQEQINGTPEEIFGTQMTSKWADLAFATPPSKKSS